MKNNKENIKGRGAQINPNNPFDPVIREEEIHLSEDEKVKTDFIKGHPSSIINQVNSPDLNFEYSLNPYQGCEHGCIYCYARDTHKYWDYSAGLDFETKIVVKENAPQLLEKALNKAKWIPKPVMLSGNTDCYQPAEKKYEITRKILEVFVKYRHPVSIVTKNDLILRDLDLLKDLAQDNLIKVALTITTLDENLRRIMEPRTSSSTKRLRTIETLNKSGIPCGVMIAPVIPGLNDQELLKIAKLSREHQAAYMEYSIVRLNGQVAMVFENWIRSHLPLKADRILNQIKACHDGKLSDSRFGERQKGTGKISEIIRQQAKLANMMYFKNGKPPELNVKAYYVKKGRQLSLFDDEEL